MKKSKSNWIFFKQNLFFYKSYWKNQEENREGKVRLKVQSLIYYFDFCINNLFIDFIYFMHENRLFWDQNRLNQNSPDQKITGWAGWVGFPTDMEIIDQKKIKKHGGFLKKKKKKKQANIDFFLLKSKNWMIFLLQFDFF